MAQEILDMDNLSVNDLLVNVKNAKDIPIKRLLSMASQSKYRPRENVEDPQEQEYENKLAGLTKEQVMAVRLADQASHGNKEAANMLMDRIYGKPLQVNENINVSVNYSEFLDNLPDDDTHDDQTIDVTPTTTTQEPTTQEQDFDWG